jgi:anti-sigma B factor antagonist
MRDGERFPASRVSLSDGTAGSDELCHSRARSNGVHQESFAVAVQRRDDRTIVHPRGALDIASVETLRAALQDVQVAEGLVLDLRGLSFIDSTGLQLLVALDRRARRDGFELSLVAPPAPVDSAIRLCALDRVLPVVTDVEAS